jgi:hypothetical protein
MARFEYDLENNPAPIPNSGCYLLVHVYKKLTQSGTLSI